MTLEYSEVLQILAEVSVTLAGFIGVILVFQRGARGSWGPSEKNTMFHLLFTSLSVLGLSLLPLLLQPGFTESIWIWRICIPLLGAAHLLGASRAFFEHRRGEITLSPQAIHIFSFGSGLFFVLTIAIAAGFLLNIAPLAYFFGLGWMLAVAVSSFVSLVFRDTV